MSLIVLSVIFATFLWWFSTGVIFYLNSRAEHTYRWSMLSASVLALVALTGFWLSAKEASASAAFLAFSCGLLLWGWHAMSYYMGIITGPRREACPPGCTGLARFRRAAATSLHHEVAILATAALLAALSWGQPNLFGLWTFLLLWGMHISAKLNVFLGVRNLNVEFLPNRLSYLSSYFRSAPMNLLFPLSVTLGTVLTIVLILTAVRSAPGTLEAVGYTLLATLSALAVIEHWFMVLPIRAEALWQWSIRPASSGAEYDSPGNEQRTTYTQSSSNVRSKEQDSPSGAAKA
jgi:putative photosynthetic complex assembly protein 2